MEAVPGEQQVSEQLWAGGSAAALSLSRPSQASLTLQPSDRSIAQGDLLQRGSSLAARQLPDQSTTLRVESSSTDDSRLHDARP
jgi:hypothetical protein